MRQRLTVLAAVLLLLQLFFTPVYAYEIEAPEPEGWVEVIRSGDVSVTIPHIPPIRVPRVEPPSIIIPKIPEPPRSKWSYIGDQPESGSSSSSSSKCNPYDISTWGYCLTEAVWSGVEGVINTIQNAISAAFRTIANGILGAVESFAQFIANLAATIANGIATAVELIANMPAQFLNGYWELTIGSLVDALAPLGWAKPFAAPLAYTALIAETIPVVLAIGYLGKFVVEALKTVIMAVI